jgi:hypothetical protein
MTSFFAHMLGQPDAGYRKPIRAVAPQHAFDGSRQFVLARQARLGGQSAPGGRAAAYARSSSPRRVLRFYSHHYFRGWCVISIIP